MSSFRQTVTGERFDGTGTLVKGRYTASTTSPISFEASVQPATGEEMLSLPEGRRDRESYRLYTSFALQTTDEENKIQADRVGLFGNTFEVVRVEPWQNNVINHFKAIVSRINID